MLKIQELLHKDGVKKTTDRLSLTVKYVGDLMILKYNQIKSNFGNQATKEARGIILHKDTFEVISLAFTKFANYTDSKADTIDWSTARVQKKLDGSIIQLYYYDGWNVGTSGTIDGNGILRDTEISYAELFWSIVSDKFVNKLDKDLIYVFELTTDKHTVVTPFDSDAITLLTVRDRRLIGKGESELDRGSVEKIGNSLSVDVIEEYPITSIEGVLSEISKMKFLEEGYVVVDGNFNRIKVKNPGWMAAHHNKGQTLNDNKLVDILKSNEVIEFIEAYPAVRNILPKMKKEYDNLVSLLNDVAKNKGKLSGSDLARFIHETIKRKRMKANLVGLSFAFINGDTDDVYEFLNKVPNKKFLKYIK